jgi:mannose-6-phosphate isomerase-like protein (cupin superfamily)
MPDYALVHLDEVTDILGDYPGEMKPMKNPLGTTQVALTYRRMPAQTGAKGSYGHRHKTQEEVIFVTAGTVQVKVGDEVIAVPAGAAIRIAPRVAQGTWNEGPEEAEILIISNRMEPEDVVEKVQGFWPDDTPKLKL